MIVKNKAFRKAMKEEGLEKVQLTKDNAQFTIWSDDEKTALEISGMYNSSIAGVFAFKELSIEKWIKEIKKLFREDIIDYDLTGNY